MIKENAAIASMSIKKNAAILKIAICSYYIKNIVILKKYITYIYYIVI